MNELKDLFDTVLAEPGRDRLDVDAAVRRGRRRRAARTGAVLASTAVAVGLAAALVVSALPQGATPLATPPTSSAISSPSPVPDRTPVQDPSQLLGQWEVTDLGGHSVWELLKPATEGTFDPIILGVLFERGADGTWTWKSHDYCNEIRGTFTVDSGRFAAVRTESTKWNCSHSDQVAQADAGRPSIEALTEADEAWFARDPTTGMQDLVLGKDGAEVARYTARRGQQEAQAYLDDSPELTLDRYGRTEPVPDAEALLGNWRWTEIGGHDLSATSQRRDLWFDREEDGTYVWSGNDGCNGWVGTFTVKDGRFRVPTKGAATFVSCSTTNVPAAASILALTTADEVRIGSRGGPDQNPTLLLVKDGRVLATYEFAPYSRPDPA